jgi:hypothetical protein
MIGRLLLMLLIIRYTYFYIPNNTLEVKYGNVSEFVILFRLLTNKVNKKI